VRQREVAQLVAAGMTNRQIAYALSASASFGGCQR
jgi:DNA-binding NarL/FixJ family response regulator